MDSNRADDKLLFYNIRTASRFRKIKGYKRPQHWACRNEWSGNGY